MSTTENIYVPNIAVIDRIEDNIEDVKTFYWRFEDPAAQAAFKKFKPGQFAQVSLFGIGEFPLSLPPSPTEEEVFFTCRTVGVCSAALHKLKAGDKFAVRGPYGNGFQMEDYYGKSLVFVSQQAGGAAIEIIHADGTPRTKHVITNLNVEVDAAGNAATCRSYVRMRSSQRSICR